MLNVSSEGQRLGALSMGHTRGNYLMKKDFGSECIKSLTTVSVIPS